MKPESKRQITVEDLLRLKRAERPPAEFWSQFDRELRAKQLAALVAKRPWWQSLPGAFSSFHRYRIPLGAAAIVAVTLVTLRDSGPAISTPHPADVAGNLNGVDAVVSASAAEAPRIDAAAPEVRQAPEIRVTAVAVAPQPEVASAGPSLASDATMPGELSQMIPLLGVSGAGQETEPTPSARYIAANLAAVHAAEPIVSRGLLGGAHALDGRSVSARSAVEPLQQITPPSETRRARYMHALVAMASHDKSPHTTERVASRIDEERLYDRVSRFVPRGDGVKVKF